MRRTLTALGVLVVTAAVPILAQRFDNLVRADFFAGFRGDQARPLPSGSNWCSRLTAARALDSPLDNARSEHGRPSRTNRPLLRRMGRI